jgi:hypothetical protein
LLTFITFYSFGIKFHAVYYFPNLPDDEPLSKVQNDRRK